MTTVSVDNDYRIVVITDGNGDTAVVTAPSPAVTVETIGLGPQGPGGILGLYATIIDTTDQPLTTTSAAQPITLNTTLESRGISVTSNSRITFELAGTYKILASLQFTNIGNVISEVNIFFRKNGTNITNSNTRIDLEPRKSVGSPYHDCTAIEYQLTVAANDYVELWWAATAPDITLETIPSDALHPQAPSVIVNVAQVMYSQAGVPIGGNTGDILVKTSATNYATAWTDAPTVDKLGLDLTAAETVSPGQLAWNATEGTMDLGTPGVTYQLGQELAFRCKNVSADVITDGEAVMFMGADATTGHLEIAHMISNGTVPGYVFFGVATEPIAIGALGYVTTLGKVRGIDTSAFPDDSVLWLDPATPGGFTLTEPSAPALKVPAAAVVKSHPTDGILFVRAETGRTIAECHDVEIGLGAADREYLGWSETYQRWQPTKIPNAAPRSITIAGPKSGDNFTLFRTDVETTITTVTALVSGTSPSVTYEIRYASNRTSAGTLATISETVTNSTIGDGATVQNQPIPANSYVWLVITSVAGTVGEMNVTIAF
jgi:hypothetical protein